ncbi:MAG: peptide chain release factor N(5)-glutamine methyltransferase [Candidatus Margulisbacteria bacterium]|jgi:release factor glutamine methyltransferase|nr:peptide chain release factor N(5)-glutamine methyltransferase [Candidatus Margulisiibacteriota bacterium]
MNLGAALDWAADQLAAKQIADPRLEAELLIMHALDLQRNALIMNQAMTVDQSGLARFKKALERRLKHEPTAYIIGDQPFHGVTIKVNKQVLIPRPETEQLVDIVIKEIQHLSLDIGHLTLADIGTGSGCIAVALAKALPQAVVYGIDQSGDALKIAQQNAAQNGVADRCRFLKGNLLEPLKEKPDLVVANPPYIPTAEINKLQPEVKDWEPRAALDGGPDGLKYIRELIKAAPARLYLEFGFGQAAKITELARAVYPQIEIRRDHAGLERYFIGGFDELSTSRPQ